MLIYTVKLVRLLLIILSERDIKFCSEKIFKLLKNCSKSTLQDGCKHFVLILAIFKFEVEKYMLGLYSDEFFWC